jgi:hypothetical protein
MAALQGLAISLLRMDGFELRGSTRHDGVSQAFA